MTITSRPSGDGSGGPGTIGALFAAQALRHGHQPLLTFYDDATGERTELSYATFDNWACKSANLLVELLGVRRGGRVEIHVTRHWIGWVLAVAAWKVGARVQWGSAADQADVLALPESLVGRDATAHPGLLVVGPGLGGRLTGPAPGVAYGDEVLAYDDEYHDPLVSPDDVAVGGTGPHRRQRELLEAAEVLRPVERVMTTAALSEPAVVVRGLLSPALAGGSTLWCPRPGGGELDARARDERVSLVLDGSVLRAV